ncbi:MAG: hypothetical protein N2652_04715 [Kiritimatiellae bacterium]|nr:hypothetical protein [Kiritimatiellia bacterium]
MATDAPIGPRRSRATQRGQALLELAIMLVAVMVIVAGLIQIGRLALVHLDTIHEARGLAAQYAMSDTYQSMMPSGLWIQEWDEGRDRRRHSRDDAPVIGSSHVLRQFVLPVARPSDLHARLPRNRVSRLQFAEQPIEEFEMVRASAQSRPVPLLPVVRHLLYRADTIRLESEATLVWTRGLE